ncbi:zinc finger CCCH domain-containing protein 18-like isoform X3 [Lotus japonicus]|uniref:zinc finger CCCH domain-containing protein 18-like isoform X3 n=1 Tax=Lotus japonicus TaxID=34305 RepID=UPI0025864555|nr:zinc finger CCCH domain-containing protein 18-like isoform X3 [Lotus japonicus]
MDISEYTRIVFDKLHRFEPEHATKIIGYLLLQDHVDQEMVKLASFPDHLIREVALKAKTELQKLVAKSNIHPISLNPISPSTSTSTQSFQNAEFISMGYWDSMPELQKQAPMFSLENHADTITTGGAKIANEYYGLEASPGNVSGNAGRRFPNVSEFQVKTCHYFNKGYCRHGNSCRYYHGQVVPEIFSLMHGNDGFNDNQAISPGSLAQLESEIVELLKQRGNPISIASLPMAYYDKYKKVLQAEGYLTESQRHGKSGYSLTKLLIRLNNSIRVIDSRPHGQHAVVLAEDAPKSRGKVEFGHNISALRQIYLTFPADSTFTEEDVSNYFSTFGCVEDVRIPCQQRRMFGFVTFVDPETVKMILDKATPHYVRGSRVLVKPYKEKPKLLDRKYPDRIEHPDCYSPHYYSDTEFISIPRSCRNPRSLRRLLVEEQEQALEFQRRHLAALQLTQKSLSINMDGLKVSDDHFNVHLAESFSHESNNKPGYTNANYTDEDSSQVLNLPDSPFSFPVDSGISAVM